MITPLAIETKPTGPDSYEHRLILQLPGGILEPVIVERVRSNQMTPTANDVRALFIRAAEVEA